ncbi:MAG: single-stranded-DNA-specific exonuclease RecJ [bacterium]
MELHWQIKNKYPIEKINAFASELNSSPILANVLLNRGIDNLEDARIFFKPDLNNLHDPFAMSDMHKAVERIEQAVVRSQKVLIYGDYDVDGTTATSMLLRFLKRLNVQVEFYVPDRLLEGYGLSELGIKNAQKNSIDLIITVDCGITANREIALAGQLGMDVIVCDHHQPGAELPQALAILNPKKSDCPYPFKELAGVGVAFKLIQALQKQLNLDPEILQNFFGHVALGSAADIVPLVDENRIFVKFGLENMGTTDNVGIRALLDSVGLNKKNIGTGQVVFMIAPRINAVGRMGDAGRAVRLLTTENEQQAKNIATILEAENRHRRNVDEETFEQAIALIESKYDAENDRVFVLNQDGWHPGVIGIVASRIVEKFYRPTIMIATEDGKGKGSARSIPGFDIYQALNACKHLMLDFGGHKYAAGLTIDIEKITLFRETFARIAADVLTEEMLMPKLIIDAEVELNEINSELLKILNKMAPFGPQNMRPVFLTRKLEVVGTPGIVGKNHLKFKVRQNGVVMDAIGFNLGELLYRISAGEKNVEMVYTIDENEWQGRSTIQLRVKDLR